METTQPQNLNKDMTFNFDAMPKALKERMMKQVQDKQNSPKNKEQIEQKLKRAEEKRMELLRVRKTMEEKINELHDRRVNNEVQKVVLAQQKYMAKHENKQRTTAVEERMVRA